MAYGIIDLNEIFSPGTIGHDREYNPLSAQNPDFLLFQENPDFRLTSQNKLKKLEAALLDLHDYEMEHSDTDELLRKIGFPDSTESRSCIRRKSK